jgi:hypothetical protein
MINKKHYVVEVQPFANIRIARPSKKPNSQTKTCQRVWLPANRLIERIKHENTTQYIKHMAESAKLRSVHLIKI